MCSLYKLFLIVVLVTFVYTYKTHAPFSRRTGNDCESQQLKQPSLLDRLAQPDSECQQSAVYSACQHPPKVPFVAIQQFQRQLKRETGSDLGCTSDACKPSNRTSLCPICRLELPADELQAHIALELSLLTESHDDCAAPMPSHSRQNHLLKPPKHPEFGSQAHQQRSSVGKSATTRRHQHPAGQQKVHLFMLHPVRMPFLPCQVKQCYNKIFDIRCARWYVVCRIPAVPA